jgi:hypothetical protein
MRVTRDSSCLPSQRDLERAQFDMSELNSDGMVHLYHWQVQHSPQAPMAESPVRPHVLRCSTAEYFEERARRARQPDKHQRLAAIAQKYRERAEIQLRRELQSHENGVQSALHRGR